MRFRNFTFLGSCMAMLIACDSATNKSYETKDSSNPLVSDTVFLGLKYGMTRGQYLNHLKTIDNSSLLRSEGGGQYEYIFQKDGLPKFSIRPYFDSNEGLYRLILAESTSDSIRPSDIDFYGTAGPICFERNDHPFSGDFDFLVQLYKEKYGQSESAVNTSNESYGNRLENSHVWRNESKYIELSEVQFSACYTTKLFELIKNREKVPMTQDVVIIDYIDSSKVRAIETRQLRQDSYLDSVMSRQKQQDEEELISKSIDDI